jgi:crotonobetainyl-CoA:carnitine CoA-transferase CaiB-like acyl-CoA transferase
VPVAPVDNEFDSQFYTNPQVLVNDMVVQVQHPVLGDMKVSRNLVRFPDARLPAVRPTPLLGEHTQEILRELGFSAERIDQLYERGIAKTEEVPAGSGR